MKKFLISFLFIAGFAGYAAFSYLSGSSASAQTLAITSNPTTSSVVISDASPAASGSAPPADTSASSNTGTAPAVKKPVTTTPAPVPVKKPTTGQYTDGSYTGSAANAYYGNIQVEATVSGGRLTNVTFLQYPNDRSTSREINQQAMPMLKAEAIQAQSANVSGVSGASDSSAAFKESLASALAQA